MSIKNNRKDKKHPYASPTTPGLHITLRAYIIELVCLNVNKKIGPRFWSDNKYWGPKFRREIKGIDNIFKKIEESDILTQTALIQIIKEYNIKSLSYKTTVNKVVKNVLKRKYDLEQKRQVLRQKSNIAEIDAKKNSTFVDVGPKNTIARIRENENG